MYSTHFDLIEGTYHTPHSSRSQMASENERDATVSPIPSVFSIGQVPIVSIEPSDKCDQRQISDEKTQNDTKEHQPDLVEEVIDLSNDPSETLLKQLVNSVMEDVERVHVDTEHARHKLQETLDAVEHLPQREDSSLAHPFITRERERPPHTVTGLWLMVAMVIRTSFFSAVRQTMEDEIRAGLGLVAAVFLFYCTLQLQDGEVTRPHPVLWRFIHGVMILYFVFVVYLLSQTTTFSVDRTMQIVLEPTSGTALLPRYETNDYSADCSLTQANLWNKVWDRYFFAHFFGWIVKALIIRHWGLMWTCSILFEVMEVTMQKALPNFQECWWDRWGLDVFGCNLAGMYVGMKIAGWIGAREYDWSGMAVMTKRRKILQQVMKFASPRIFPRRFEWHAFSSWKRFGVSLLVVIIILMGDINGFMLKSSLRIPVASPIHTYRVIFIVPAGYASVMELYAFAEDRTNRIGRTAWLVASLIILEMLLTFKNFWMRDSFTAEQLQLEPVVQRCWFAVFVLGISMLLLKLSKAGSHRLVRVLGRLTMIPFIYILAWDMWEYGGLRKVLQP